MCVGLNLSLSRAMPFSFTAMFLVLTCCIPATIAVCEGSSVIGEEGQTAELSVINRRFLVIFHWYLNKELRYIANVLNNHVDDINKPERYQVSTNSSHIRLAIHNVLVDDTGLYLVYGVREETLEVIRLSVEGSDVLTEVDTVISRRGSTVRFLVNPCRHLFFRPTDSSSTGKFLKSSNYTSIGCSDSIIANEKHEGCYVMFHNDRSFGFYIKRIQLSDIKITVMLDRISCVEDPPASGIPFWLEHRYNENTVRKVEDNGSATLPVLPKPYHNNGIYQCISYIDNSKSAISQNKSFVYEFTGLPVFAEGNIYLLQGEYGRNLSVKVLVYSNPNITEIEVIGENRSTDGFIVHDIKTLPAFLNGWHGPNANIPGWEIIIDIVFQVPQNITLYVIVGNTIGYNKLRMTALVGDSLILMNKFAVTCNSRGLDSTLYIRLEHSFQSTVIRHTEAQASEIVQLPLLPIPFHNNGVYKCIFYTDKARSTISQTKSLLYEHKGLPVFAEGDRYLLQGEHGRNLSVKVLVYSNPNITEIEVIGENRSTDGFIVHEIKTLPASLNGRTGPSVNIPGWEITIDIMFYIPKNVTLYLIVDNIIGSNKFKMTAVIERKILTEPTTPDDSSLYSFISVATCILGILLFCIITMTTVNCIIMKRRSSTTVEIERSPYTYDEIGTIDYRVTNVPPPLRDVVVPEITRRMELNRAIANISQDQISIETQGGQHDDMITIVNAIDTTETRTYLSLPCSVRSSDTTNEEEITPTFEIDNENIEIESVIGPQKSELSSNKIKVLANDEHNNEIQFPLDQLVADININEHLVIDDSDSSNSDVPLAAVEPDTQHNLYEAVSSNIPLEHLYNQCETSRDTDTQEVPKEYINLKIW